MTSRQQTIINYITAISKGLVCISAQHADDIIGIVNSNDLMVGAKVNMYQWNNSFKRYDFLRTLITSEDKVAKFIELALAKRPVEMRIKYECYNSQCDFQGCIYTSDASIFD